MPAEKPNSPPKALADAERDADAALEFLLKCAVNVGKGEPGAVVRAQSARQLHTAALNELRRSERARGRTGSINWLSSQMGVSLHSANAKGPGADSIDWRKDLEAALEALSRATW